jgi:hypothetical protein
MIWQIHSCDRCGAMHMKPGMLPDVEGDGISQLPAPGPCAIVWYSKVDDAQQVCAGTVEFRGYVSLMNVHLKQDPTVNRRLFEAVNEEAKRQAIQTQGLRGVSR